MNVLIVTDFRAVRFNGVLYVGTQFSTIAKRYKEAFGSISLCLRVSDTDEVPSGYECAKYYVDEYIPISGFNQLLNKKVQLDINQLIEKSNLIVIRCPSVLGIVVAEKSRQIGKPYLVELMGDAWDAYWNHGLRGKIIAPFIFILTRRCVARANYAQYVTEHYLQKRYPCKELTVSASNVLLKTIEDKEERHRPMLFDSNVTTITLMTTGAIDVEAKGQRFVIKAIPLLNRAGIKVKYRVVGGGNKDALFKLAKDLDVLDQVTFCGRQSLDEVFELLESVDIYIQPSLQEGLPRSVIEAMSKGCLVIGTKTAGTPELVPNDCLVRRRSTKDIVNKILYILNLTSAERRVMSNRNLEKAKEYQCCILDKRRNEFYKKIVYEINEN